jgi:hypothetical protein
LLMKAFNVEEYEFFLTQFFRTLFVISRGKKYSFEDYKIKLVR